MTSPSADVSVRPATPADVEAIAILQLDSWRNALGTEAVAGLDSAAIAASWRQAVSTPPDPRSRVLVALTGSHVVGFSAAAPEPHPAGEPWTVEVLALEVDPAHQRQGHGSRLLAAQVDLARERGATSLAAWMLQRDEIRLAFLTGAGLHEVGLRRRLQVPGGEVEEIKLTATLGGEPGAGESR